MPARLPSVKYVTCAAVRDNSDWMIVGVDQGLRANPATGGLANPSMVPFIPGISVELKLTIPSGPVAWEDR
jgi:hypothetical protein